jgi:hypothetical protein
MARHQTVPAAAACCREHKFGVSIEWWTTSGQMLEIEQLMRNSSTRRGTAAGESHVSLLLLGQTEGFLVQACYRVHNSNKKVLKGLVQPAGHAAAAAVLSHLA